MDIAFCYFDTLPLHPCPRPLESFTSYLTRIAEANGISHLSILNAFFGRYSQISRFVDYPARSFGTSYLGVPLSHIFINAVERKEEDLRISTLPGKYFLTAKDLVMERVQEAARQLEKSGQYITI